MRCRIKAVIRQLKKRNFEGGGPFLARWSGVQRIKMAGKLRFVMSAQVCAFISPDRLRRVLRNKDAPPGAAVLREEEAIWATE